MNATYALLGAAVALALASCSGASAAPSGPISLDASGYAAIDGAIRAVSMDLTLSARDDGTFLSAGGLIVIGTETLTSADIDGSFTRDAKTINVSGTADGRGEQVIVKLDGRLTDTRGDDSTYLLTGTLERGGTVGKAAFAAILSPLLSSRTIEAAPATTPSTADDEDAHTLEAFGYTTVGETIEAISLNMVLSTDDDAFSSSSGTLGIGGYALGTLDINGLFTRGARIVDVSGTAEGRGEPANVKLFGRIIDKHDGDSAYIFTGTLERGGATGKTVLTALISTPTAPKMQAPADALLVTLRAEPRQPGAPPGHFDEPILRVRPGQNITITNTDAEAHRLVSGAVNDWFYERSTVVPRMCGPDGTPDIEDDRPRSNRKSSAALERDKCDFTRDDRVDVEIEPGESRTVNIADTGIYRILDPASPWLQLIAVSVDSPARCPPHCQR